MNKRMLILLVLMVTLLPVSALAGSGQPGSIDDCLPGSHPGYWYLDKLFVSGVCPGCASYVYPPTASFSGLAPGQYLIEASGIYGTGGTYASDAEYVQASSTGPWKDFVPGYETDPLGECLDELHVDGQCVEWGTLALTHVYALPWTVNGNTLDFQLKDWYARNNTGGLCVGLFSRLREVEIDIKPGSDPNCFNINDHGVIPVAINGSQELDVNDIRVETLVFAGLDVRVKGNGAPQCSIKDWNRDGLDDLVCQFVDDVSTWSPDNGTASLSAELTDGRLIQGSDSICIVPAQ